MAYRLSYRMLGVRPALVLAVMLLYQVDFGLSDDNCLQGNYVTPDMKSVVIGRCTDYQTVVQPDLFCGSRWKNCTELWDLLVAGFAHQPLCNVSTSGFEGFLAAADHPLPVDKQLFYEDTYTLVHRYSNRGQRLTTIEDTLYGYIADNLHFCGSEDTADGVAMGTTCPSFTATNDCPLSAERAFWIAASRHFASRATGAVHVMLNATSSPILSTESYFASYELTSWKSSRVSKVNILLIDDFPEQVRSPCQDPSISVIERGLVARNIPVECIENPRDVMLLYCVDYPDGEPCGSLTDGSTSGACRTTPVFILLLCIALSMFL